MSNQTSPNNRLENDKSTVGSRQRVSLRLAASNPLITVLLLVVLFFLLIARLNAPEDAVLQALGVGGESTLRAGYYRIMTALLLTALPRGGDLWWAAGHVILNFYTLYIVGVSTERIWGSARFGLLYLLGGATGATLTLLLVPLNWLAADRVLSGAVYGVLALVAGELVYLYKHRRLYRAQGNLRRNYLIGLAVLNGVVGLFLPQQVSWLGMLGGLAGGALLAAFISPLHMPRPHPTEPGVLQGEDINPLRARLIFLALYITGVLGLVLISLALMSR